MGFYYFTVLANKRNWLGNSPHTLSILLGVVSVPQLAFFSPLRTRLLLFSLAIANPLLTSACTTVPPWPPLEWAADPSALWTMTEQTADWAHCKLSHHQLCGLCGSPESGSQTNSSASWGPMAPSLCSLSAPQMSHNVSFHGSLYLLFYLPKTILCLPFIIVAVI